MTLGTQDLELIKREIADIRGFYQSRMDAELPPLKEEVDRLAAQLDRVHSMWRDGEKRAILARFGGGERLRVPYGKYNGLDILGLGLHSQSVKCSSPGTFRYKSPDAGRLAS